MSEHTREPIKHTCPKIDRQIADNNVSIRNAKRILKGYEDNKDLIDVIEDLINEIEHCNECFEDLRKSNKTLREWGIDEAEHVDFLLKQNEELLEQIKELE